MYILYGLSFIMLTVEIYKMVYQIFASFDLQ